MKVHEKKLKDISKFIYSEVGLKLDSLQTLELIKESGLYEEISICFDTYLQDELIDFLSHKLTGLKWHSKKNIEDLEFKNMFKLNATNFGYAVI